MSNESPGVQFVFRGVLFGKNAAAELEGLEQACAQAIENVAKSYKLHAHVEHIP